MSAPHVVVINDFGVSRGGASTLALLLARRMLDRGHRVTYVCGDDGVTDPILAEGAEVVALGRKALLKTGRLSAMVAGLYNRRTRAILAEVIARVDSPETIYHVHGWAQILSPAVFWALRPVAARTVMHAHDMFLACPNGVFMDYRHGTVCGHAPLGLACLATNCDKRSAWHKAWRAARQAILRRALTRTDRWAAVVMVHPGVEDRLRRAKWLPETLVALRNPTQAFTATRVRAEDNAGLVYVGRLEADKGAGDIAAAATRAGMALTIIGDGPLRAEIQARYPAVRLAGWQPRERIGALLADARALVMPSRHPEPFAMVIAEASQSGLPVVLSSTAAMAPEIERAGLGWAFDPSDPDSLDRALMAVRDTPRETLRTMSERAMSHRPRLASSPDEWIETLEALYQSILSTPPRGAARPRRKR